MALDFNATLAYLETLLAGLDSLQAGGAGVPTALTNKISASVSQGGLVTDDKTTQVLAAARRYVVVYAYRLDGDERAAEYALGDFMAELITAIYADRTLGGTATNVAIDDSITRMPEYAPVLGQEVRQYRLEVRATQRQNY
jgi:hypothetical protein